MVSDVDKSKGTGNNADDGGQDIRFIIHGRKAIGIIDEVIGECRDQPQKDQE